MHLGHIGGSTIRAVMTAVRVRTGVSDAGADTACRRVRHSAPERRAGRGVGRGRADDIDPRRGVWAGPRYRPHTIRTAGTSRQLGHYRSRSIENTVSVVRQSEQRAAVTRRTVSTRSIVARVDLILGARDATRERHPPEIGPTDWRSLVRWGAIVAGRGSPGRQRTGPFPGHGRSQLGTRRAPARAPTWPSPTSVRGSVPCRERLVAGHVSPACVAASRTQRVDIGAGF